MSGADWSQWSNTCETQGESRRRTKSCLFFGYFSIRGNKYQNYRNNEGKCIKEELDNCKETCSSRGEVCSDRDDCCPNENLACGVLKHCCRETGGACSIDEDCCRGLACNRGECIVDPGQPTCKKRDVVFALETSCSIADSDKEDIRSALVEFLRKIQIDPVNGTQIGALTFNKGAHRVAYLSDSDDPDHLVRLVENMNLTAAGCRTDFFEAFRAAEHEYFTPANGDRPYVDNLFIMITDGVITDPAEVSRQSSRSCGRVQLKMQWSALASDPRVLTTTAPLRL
ncbi:unnamed protein product [Owenia fusiformis]|uniref:VWFA domain-containing protein n=1 Tax=Owenia fusiformis TaxID=6347 RepID=A0A8S4QAC3_OWEFU|nr:unnamed protein product [Owenia fusiformis]